MEIQALEGKFTGRKINEMNEHELDFLKTDILLKISAITGCKLPDSESMLNLIENEVYIAVTTTKAYAALTLAEILTAFRLNASCDFGEKIRHYGYVFNMDYFGDVMHHYKILRNQVEEKLLMDHKPKELPAPESEPLTDDEFIQMNYETWQVLKNPNVIMVKEGRGAQSCFKILLDQGKIKRLEGEEREFVIKKATADLHEEWRESGINLSHAEKEKEIQTLCKKLVVQKYFLSL